MKATQKDFSAVAPRVAGKLAIAFFCGPDEAGASAAASRLAAMLPDAGERIELSGAELRNDRVRLGDEARSDSLFGGKRHILIRAVGDEVHDAVQIHCQLIDAEQTRGETQRASPVLIVATSATDKSRTAKLLEKRGDSLVAMFYPPEPAAIATEVRRMADVAGVRLGEEMAERIARAAALDVRLAESEINKLALYLDATALSPKIADAAALDAIGARTEEDGVMPLVNAVLSGDARRLPDELRRLHDLSVGPVTVLLALERRAGQLARLAGRLGKGVRVNDVVEADRSVFWRDKNDLKLQLQRWDAPRLERLIDRLMALHRALLGNSQAAEILLSQELTQITRFAAQRR